MQKLKPGDHVHLSGTTIKVLAQNRITTILEFLQEDTERLSTVAKLSLPQILAIREDIFKKYSAPLITGTSLLVRSYMTKRLLSTGIPSLDVLTGGGLPIGSLTEICGLADSGKTQLCFQLAINCVKNSENTILYVDTKGDFSAIRIQKVLDGLGYSNKEMAMIMFKIRLVHVWTMDEMIELFKRIKNKAITFQNLNLIIIDSLACLMFQYLGDENKVGLSFLNTLVNYSRYLCKDLNVSIVCVNIQTRWVAQDVTDVEDYGDQTSATTTRNLYTEKRNRCLGKYWQHIPALVLLMEKSQERNDMTNDFYSKVIVTKCSNMKSEQRCVLKISRLGVT